MAVDKLIEQGLVDPARKLDAEIYGVIYDHFEETGDDSLSPVFKALSTQLAFTLAQIPRENRRAVMKKLSVAILTDAAEMADVMRENTELAGYATRKPQ